jgi:hypothetical protein
MKINGGLMLSEDAHSNCLSDRQRQFEFSGCDFRFEDEA